MVATSHDGLPGSTVDRRTIGKHQLRLAYVYFIPPFGNCAVSFFNIHRYVSLIFAQKGITLTLFAVKGAKMPPSDVPKKPREARKSMQKTLREWLFDLITTLKKDPSLFQGNIFTQIQVYTISSTTFLCLEVPGTGLLAVVGLVNRARNQAWRWKVESSDTFFEGRRFDQWIFSAGKTIGKKAFVITFLLSVLLIYQVYIYMYVALKGGMYGTVHIYIYIPKPPIALLPKPLKKSTKSCGIERLFVIPNWELNTY